MQELRLREDRQQRVPDEDGQVFRGADRVLEVRNVFVQVFVVEDFHDADVHVPLQVGEIHHHSRSLVNRPSDGHFDWRQSGILCDRKETAGKALPT